MSARVSSLPFMRAYAMVAVGILLIALALDSVLVWLLPQEESLHSRQYGSRVAMIEMLLLEQGAAPQRVRERYSRLRPSLEATLGMPVILYEESELEGQEALLEPLQGEDMLSFSDADGNMLLYRRLPSGQVLALGPLPEQGSRQGIETAVIVSYYLLVALFLFFWIRPFYRDLSLLRVAASRFGRDDFSTRVELDTNSGIYPVAQSFNKMAGRIQYLVTAHRDLTNAVAHELRTPLARFKFSMEMLGKTQDETRVRDYLAAMKNDVQELETLIDEMLNYAKLSEDNLQLQRHSLALNAWLERQMKPYAESSITVHLQLQHWDEGRQVSFNPDMMARALHNVLRNSLRYARSQVLVTGIIEQGQASIRVCDDGPGIDEAFHESIFEPFARLDTSRDRQSGGYGLGLAIARRIVQRHGGSIHVEHNTPSGACFILRWPYN